jgi:hypothetical protein
MLYIALRVAACFSSLALSLSSVIFRFIRIVVVSICAKKLSAALIIRLFLLISVYAFDCPFSWLSYV